MVIWLNQKNFVQLDKLEKSLAQNNYLGLLLDISQYCEMTPDHTVYANLNLLKMLESSV